jgi:hypothetical protein
LSAEALGKPLLSGFLLQKQEASALSALFLEVKGL